MLFMTWSVGFDTLKLLVQTSVPSPKSPGSYGPITFCAPAAFPVPLAVEFFSIIAFAGSWIFGNPCRLFKETSLSTSRLYFVGLCRSGS